MMFRRAFHFEIYGCSILLVFVLLVSGCAITTTVLREIAVDKFSEQQSCPNERLTYKAIAVDPHEVFLTGAPSAAVAADPERLAIWKKNADQALSAYGDLTVVGVSGCGAQRTYFCWDEVWSGRSEATNFCTAVNLDNPREEIANDPLNPSARVFIPQRLRAVAAKP